MKNKHTIFAGLCALLLPFRFNAVEEDGGGDVSPWMKSLLGLADDAVNETTPEVVKVEEPESKVGMTLQQAIAEPSEEEKAEKKTADDAAAAKVEADKAAAAAAKVVEETPIKVVKRKTTEKVATAAEIVAATAAESVRAQAAEAAKKSKDWESGLLDEEKDQLEIARFAEKANPTKYKGYGERTEKFLREHAAKTDADDFDPDSDEYKAWLAKERPAMSNSEIRILERERGAETAREEARKQSSEVLDKTFRAMEAPAVKRDADAYFTKASTEVLPPEVAKVFKESPAKAREQYPLEYEIVEKVLDAHTNVVEEMFLLTRTNPDTGRTLRAFDEANPLHMQALQLVNATDAEFKRSGGAELVRNGRRFLPRTELARVPAADRGKYWTFTSKEIADRSTGSVRAQIAQQITGENERMKKLGFERRMPAAAAAEAPAKKSPPAPRPSVNTGTGEAAGSAGDNLMSSFFGT